MGTAPTERQYPAMPDPQRVVSRSAAMLARLGLSEIAACDVILVAVNRVRLVASEKSPEFRQWLDSVADIAVRRALASPSSRTDDRRNDHAHG